MRLGEDLFALFAEVVAAPGRPAMLLNPDNTLAGYMPLARALQRGRTFFVEVADDVLAVDSDRPADTVSVERFAQELRERDLKPVLVDSGGGPGRRHLFARVPTPNLLKALKTEARDRGLDVRPTIRPPLALHRQGGRSTLIEPRDPIQALAALLPRQCRRLSPESYALLRMGDRTGRYRSRSEVTLALALAMVNARWPEAAITRALLDPKNIGGVKVQELARTRGERRARAYVGRLYARASERWQASPPRREERESARAAVAGLRHFVEHMAWRGKAGGTDSVVILAHLEIAHRLAATMYNASARQIAEATGAHRITVQRSHRRLVRAGWLVCERTGRGSEATTWTLLRLPDSLPPTCSCGAGGGV